MRLFTAFFLSPLAIEELKRAQKELIVLNSGLPAKWIEPRDFHLTMEFLGELNESRVETVKKILKKAVAGSRCFQCRLEQLGVFPNRRRPGVLQARISEQGKESSALRLKIHRQLKNFNLIEDNKPWRPHVTLGRVKKCPARPIAGLEMKLNPVEWEVGGNISDKKQFNPRRVQIHGIGKIFIK